MVGRAFQFYPKDTGKMDPYASVIARDRDWSNKYNADKYSMGDDKYYADAVQISHNARLAKQVFRPPGRRFIPDARLRVRYQPFNKRAPNGRPWTASRNVPYGADVWAGGVPRTNFKPHADNYAYGAGVKDIRPAVNQRVRFGSQYLKTLPGWQGEMANKKYFMQGKGLGYQSTYREQTGFLTTPSGARRPNRLYPNLHPGAEGWRADWKGGVTQWPTQENEGLRGFNARGAW